MLTCVWLFVTLWTVAQRAPLSMELSWQEYWSGMSSPPPGDLADPGIKPKSLVSPALAGRFFNMDTIWVKEESEKTGLKLSIQKTKIMASEPITSWQIDGEKMETVTDFILGLQNHCVWWLQPWN